MIRLPTLSTTSQHPLRWQFDEAPSTPAGYFSEEFDHYQLEGRVLPIAGGEKEIPQTLVIHGARSDYIRLNALLYPLQALGIASLSFNLSGHSTAANVALENTSLENNLKESLRFADGLGTHLHTVIGHSMGGALALKVAEAHRSSVKNIVLCCPALYSDDAYNPPFGTPFRKAISVPFNFLESSSLKFLRKFEGKLMLIIGQHDGLKSSTFGGVPGTAAGNVITSDDQLAVRKVNSAIPYEVIKAIENNLTPHQFKKIVLPRCDHGVLAWLRDYPLVASNLASTIAKFVTQR
ncbi:alpha/beta fold hydrolase [Glaciimonas immobilis]|nr:alpha/beta fold hydrolase [Glaciimonas immobilis]